MREYGGYNGAFDFGRVSAACAGNLAPGGVLVWVVKDSTASGKESGSSFQQSVAYMDLGLDLHQTLIYECWSLAGMRSDAYFSQFSYMFCFSRGRPRVANLLHDKLNEYANAVNRGSFKGRHKDAKAGTGGAYYRVMPIRRRGNIWRYDTVPNAAGMNGGLDIKGLESHPAQFP